LEWYVQSVSVVGFSPEYAMLYCVAGALPGTELISEQCTVLYIILTSDIYNLYFILYGRTVTLGLTQHLTEMSIRNIPWRVKVAGAYGWQPYHFQVPTVLKSGSLILLELSGPVQACNVIAFNLFYTILYYHPTENSSL
jgi:hypothetical protein